MNVILLQWMQFEYILTYCLKKDLGWDFSTLPKRLGCPVPITVGGNWVSKSCRQFWKISAPVPWCINKMADFLERASSSPCGSEDAETMHSTSKNNWKFIFRDMFFSSLVWEWILPVFLEDSCKKNQNPLALNHSFVICLDPEEARWNECQNNLRILQETRFVKNPCSESEWNLCTMDFKPASNLGTTCFNTNNK